MATQAAFKQLDAALQQAQQGRTLVKNLDNARNGCGVTAPQAVGELNTILASRNDVKQRALSAAALLPGGLPVANELAKAMQTSIDADTAWEAWFVQTYQAYSNAGCQGSPQTTGDPNYDRFYLLSAQSEADKQQFLSDYNPQAQTYGLKSDWHKEDI